MGCIEGFTSKAQGYRFCGRLLVAILLLLPAHGRGQNKRLDQPPKLVLQIVMGSVSTEAIHRSWEHLTPGGLVRIMERGVVCQNARQSQLVSHSINSLAALSTGTDCPRHGVPSHRWYSQVTGDEVLLTHDKQERIVGVSRGSEGHSPRQLLVSSLPESWRMAYPDARIYSIALSPDEAILLGGRSANAALWLDAPSGHFVTSSFYTPALPTWVEAYNRGGLSTLYLGQKWYPLRSAHCYASHQHAPGPDSSATESGGSNLPPLHTGGYFNEISLYGPRYNRLGCTPQGNTLIKDLTIRAIEADSLGRGGVPDLLLLYYTALERIGTLYGPESMQMEDALLRYDSEVADLLAYLDATIGTQNYLVVLTAAYTPEASPDRLAKWHIPSGRFNADRAVVMLNSYLRAFYSLDRIVLGHSGQQIYLNQRLIESERLSLREVEDLSVKFLQNMAGIARVYPSHLLEYSSFSDSRAARLQGNYHPKRGGNLLIDLQAGWVVESPLSAQAIGSSMSYDARVPLVFYGWKLRRKRVSAPVYLRDVAPTLCELYRIPQPNAASGAPIPGVADWE